MLEGIAAGSRIHIKVVKTPRSAAAVKTLVRVLSRDRAVQREDRRLTEIRKALFHRKPRGGRGYPLHAVKQRPVRGTAGESGTITASIDVFGDLRSIARFIEVSPA